MSITIDKFVMCPVFIGLLWTTSILAESPATQPETPIQKVMRELTIPASDYIWSIEEPPIDDASVDLTIFSQALHHAEHPERAIASAYRILAPGGTLVILDLLQHSFDQARDLYADTWLGFPEVELFKMMEKAGFKNIETTIVDKESEAPHFQTLLATAQK